MAEAVGFVLAAFPLVIEGLHAYVRGIELMEKWRGYRQALQRIIQALGMEEATFKNTCTRLLYDCVDFLQASTLVIVPGGDYWQDETIQDSLRSLLGSSFDVFSYAVESLTNSFEKLKEELGLDANYKPQWLKFKAHKREWKRLMFSLRDGRLKDLLSDMDKTNKDIANLVGHSQHMSTRRLSKTHANANAKRYEYIRSQAKNLHNVLKHNFTWQCGCSNPHCASLCLEHRGAAGAARKDRGISFNVLLSVEVDHRTDSAELPWNWRETTIEPFDFSHPQDTADRTNSSQDELVKSMTLTAARSSSTSAIAGVSLAAMGGPGGVHNFMKRNSTPAGGLAHTETSLPVKHKKVSFAMTERTELQGAPQSDDRRLEENLISESPKIEDLCRAMLSASEVSCLGVLADGNRTCHRLSITNLPSGKEPMQTVSLEDLLTQTQLERKERLILGLKLASSLLQLHSTPWLTETWGKIDVRFKRQKGSHSAFLSRPFFTKKFLPPNYQISDSEPGNITLPHGIRNQSIFALGLILTELWFGKPVDQLRASTDLDSQNQANGLTDFATSIRLLKSIYSEAGEFYGDAVRRCIRCDFNQKHDDLEAAVLKEAVHDGVVAPLEEHLRFFCGGNLDGVLS